MNINHNEMKKQNRFLYQEIFETTTYKTDKKEIENATIIDIGANIGFFAFKCLELGAKEVICFEPEKYNYEQLETNVKNFEIENIKTYNLALLDDKTEFVHIDNNKACSTIYNNGKQKVESISLEKAMSLNELSGDLILKIDCEGSEFEILFSSKKELLQKFKTIYIEIHEDMNPNEEYTNIKMIEYLQDLGFKKTYKANQLGIREKGVFVPLKVES